jgi:hypothetical protein
VQANPTAVVILALALVLIIVAYKGTQANWVAAVLGHAPAGVGATGSSGAPSITGNLPPGSALPEAPSWWPWRKWPYL